MGRKLTKYKFNKVVSLVDSTSSQSLARGESARDSVVALTAGVDEAVLLVNAPPGGERAE